MISRFYLIPSGSGEGSFQINPLKDKYGKIEKFSFIFNINLHLDDIDSLNTIVKLLGIGTVTRSDPTSSNKYICTYRVNKQKELAKLIEILKTSPLNGIKYLDFLDFVKAYELYFNRPNGTFSSDLIEEILNLKAGMNRQRINKERPIDIKITDY